MSETYQGERICYIEPFDAESSTIEYREENVRCRDCEYYEGVLCTNGFIDGNPDAFCSWGERRDA